jgi:hypothetical protein
VVLTFWLLRACRHTSGILGSYAFFGQQSTEIFRSDVVVHWLSDTFPRLTKPRI